MWPNSEIEALIIVAAKARLQCVTGLLVFMALLILALLLPESGRANTSARIHRREYDQRRSTAGSNSDNRVNVSFNGV
jgi:hypothetical protein